MILNESVWVDVECQGENTKQTFVGRFKIKPFLTHMERADAVRLAERYSRGILDDDAQKTFLRLLAFLKFYIVEADADWWTNDGTDLVDEVPIYELISKLRKLQGKEEEKKDDQEISEKTE